MEPLDLKVELARAHPRCFGWALRCCRGRRQDAEDVLHLAYVKVLDGRARFDGRSAFRTWLFGVIRRTAVEESRRWWTGALMLGEWWRDRPSVAEGPADGVVRADTAGRLERMLLRLSTRQQEVLHLVFYQDLTVEEAAAVLGIPVGTARTHYQRGKARMRTLLAGENER